MYEATLVGGVAAYVMRTARAVRFRRFHATAAAAHAEGTRLLRALAREGWPTACHTLIVYDSAGRVVDDDGRVLFR